MSSPTQRSLKKLRADGYMVEVVEKWNSFTRSRKDLFGFGDLLCVRGNEVLLVQTTSGSNVSARIEKIRSLQSHELWLASPNRRIVVHGWRKVGKAGERKLWECREVELTASQPGEGVR
jgi:hypothetical protein